MINKDFFFSVVICTYNRSSILKRAVESVIEQSLDKTKYEIIVMDDGSTDETLSFLQRFSREVKQPIIKFYSHKNLGLAHSRNLAVSKAKGKYLAFLDDDAKADKKWLEQTMKILKHVKPAPLGISGPVLTYYESDKPSWFKDSYEEDIKGNIARFLKYGEAFSGPNMILDKDLIRDYDGFDESIDMKAEILMLGEETRLFEKIWHRNPHANLLYYSPEVKVYHLVHPYKMTVSYRLKRWFASGQSYYLRHKNVSIISLSFFSFKVFAFFVLSLSLVPLTIIIYRWQQNWIIERIGPILFVLGYFSALLNLNLTMKHATRV